MTHTVSLHCAGTIVIRDPRVGGWSDSRKEALLWTFDPADPAAVTLTIDTVPWTFDRTLAEQAVADMTRPLGDVWLGAGDVQIARVGMSHVQVLLKSQVAEARVELKATDLIAFVRQVTIAVPDHPDGQMYDVDAWLADLLREDAS